MENLPHRISGIVLFAPLSIAGAADLTVGKDGAADFADIQAAIDAAVEGDGVVVGPGEYLVPSPLTFRGKAIEVRATEGPERTVILRSEPPDSQEEEMVIAFRDGEGEGSVLRGFTVAGHAEDLREPPYGLRSTLGGGILFEGPVRPTLIDCVVACHEAEYGGGLACRRGASPTLSRCTIARNGAWGGGGVWIEDGSPLFEDCVILANVAHAPDTGGGGIGVVGGSPRFLRCRIAGNFGGCGSAVHVDDASPLFENCRIYGHPFYAIEVACGDCREPLFVGCTIAGNDWDTSVCHDFHPWPYLDCIVSSRWDAGWSPWTADRPNLSDRDPLFASEGTFAREQWEVTVIAGRAVNAPGFVVEEPDHRLRPGSPAIDAGIAAGAPAADLEGRPRPCGVAVDLGAYESGDCAAPARFRRGDSNDDGKTDIADAIGTLGHLFLGSPARLDCAVAADSDDSGAVDLSDGVYLLGYLFLGGPAPPPPYPGCGGDPTADGLTCEGSMSCP